GWTVDVAGFDAAMKAQKEAARAAWAGSGETADEKIFLELADKNGPTEFLGYANLTSEAVVADMLKKAHPVDTAKEGDEVIICVNQTPFYGESGGQVGDTGVMGWTDGSAVVTNTAKTAGLILHHVRIETGILALGQAVSLKVDSSRRAGLRAHHSATHLLHEALRQVLGDHVAQKGSLVTDTRLRFDFSHPKAMTNEEISAVEEIVNDRIRMNSQVATKIMAPDEAINEGALALFGEKYGDEVRVVSMGGAADQVGRSAWSVELCGGTHVDQTGDIALLHVISESAVAGGVRRIEAATHAAGFAGLVANKAILSELSVELKTPPDHLASRVSQLLDERKALEREVTKLRRQMATGSGTSEAEQIGNVAYIA
ncbi:MAG: alanine--tRNA ligase-related protein, partial [Pseudomonadota bacterium]|nr:alanine--tRNA ligase-related protein [Pseudomonadota bacterium]